MRGEYVVTGVAIRAKATATWPYDVRRLNCSLEALTRGGLSYGAPSHLV